MSDRITHFSETLYEYISQNCEPEVPIVQNIRESGDLAVPGLQVFVEQAQFLCFLVVLMGARKTLDIGSFRGYSALVVALDLPEDGVVVACEVNPKDAELARQHFDLASVSAKVDLRVAPATDTLQSLIDSGEGGTFDFAFIDADKRGNGKYYEQCLQLVRSGGCIAIDNTLWGGRVSDVDVSDARTVAIRTFNEFVQGDARVRSLLLPAWDGVTIAIVQ